jgi:hypothetical protein
MKGKSRWLFRSTVVRSMWRFFCFHIRLHFTDDGDNWFPSSTVQCQSEEMSRMSESLFRFCRRLKPTTRDDCWRSASSRSKDDGFNAERSMSNLVFSVVFYSSVSQRAERLFWLEQQQCYLSWVPQATTTRLSHCSTTLVFAVSQLSSFLFSHRTENSFHCLPLCLVSHFLIANPDQHRSKWIRDDCFSRSITIIFNKWTSLLFAQVSELQKEDR